MDHVDKIAKQWNTERPDLDVGAMEIVGRFGRITNHLRDAMGKTFADYGLNGASFDVLATLRRSGQPYALSPGELIKATMVTSGTMTNRIDQLVKAGLVARVKNREDARSFVISLTDKGFDLIERVVGEHVKTQQKLVEGLTPDEALQLNELLKKFLAHFEAE
ncbi:MarR family winged helix-turn-helix transcriptional regulator [Sneathiella glossodoripedis]|uniref:MarR family winged helix-turn-helix transcriptional regulator n=1 Tax=Sneathiella glossodoripedis TaxID=418853 RepID=UPI0004722B5F|nr:MarR family transcriptional regulator [Sneathiella glossodoripedis]